MHIWAQSRSATHFLSHPSCVSESLIRPKLFCLERCSSHCRNRTAPHRHPLQPCPSRSAPARCSPTDCSTESRWSEHNAATQPDKREQSRAEQGSVVSLTAGCMDRVWVVLPSPAADACFALFVSAAVPSRCPRCACRRCCRSCCCCCLRSLGDRCSPPEQGHRVQEGPQGDLGQGVQGQRYGTQHPRSADGRSNGWRTQAAAADGSNWRPRTTARRSSAITDDKTQALQRGQQHDTRHAVAASAVALRALRFAFVSCHAARSLRRNRHAALRIRMSFETGPRFSDSTGLSLVRTRAGCCLRPRLLRWTSASGRQPPQWTPPVWIAAAVPVVSLPTIPCLLSLRFSSLCR